jgi:hypothetical protein
MMLQHHPENMKMVFSEQKTPLGREQLGLELFGAL